jgi:hypothetical protein
MDLFYHFLTEVHYLESPNLGDTNVEISLEMSGCVEVEICIQVCSTYTYLGH